MAGCGHAPQVRPGRRPPMLRTPRFRPFLPCRTIEARRGGRGVATLQARHFCTVETAEIARFRQSCSHVELRSNRRVSDPTVARERCVRDIGEIHDDVFR